MPVTYHDLPLHPPPPSPPPPPDDNKWSPYSGAGEFNANMATILIILFCALILALSLNAAIRFILRHLRRPPPDPAKRATINLPEPLPTVVFPLERELAGAATECAICLCEFADGDVVKVLPACNHGFHVRCVEEWLATRLSCPTCRRSCWDVKAVEGRRTAMEEP